MNTLNKWDIRFLNLAKTISKWSKDQKKKVGAIIVDEDRRIISTGYNGIAMGLQDDIEERHQKPLKLSYFVHAESNAIYSAAKSGIKTKGCAMYITFHPCASCANAIIQSGINKVVCYKPELGSSWIETANIAKNMFEEAGIEVKYHND